MKVVKKVVSYGIKQGTTATKEALNTWKYPVDIYYGAKSVNRLRKIQHHNIWKTIGAHVTNILRKTGKHLPGICAGAATPVPVPGTSALAFGIGKILQKIIKLI